MESKILSGREVRIYSKHIMIPEIGIAGQEKLKKARVLVVGAGGLGCSVLQYLSISGTGKLGIAEFDMVNESNLHRQVLYGSNDVGKLKSIIARNRLEGLNPLVETEVYNLRIDRENGQVVFREYDIIVDATDNFETRYAIDDSCIALGKPMVHGSIYKFEGLVSVFNYRNGPTYRCYNPPPPGKDYKNPVPADVGMFGVLPGITGLLMANEVIKIITETGEVLSGKVLIFNLMNNKFSLFTVNRIQEGIHNQ